MSNYENLTKWEIVLENGDTAIIHGATRRKAKEIARKTLPCNAKAVIKV